LNQEELTWVIFFIVSGGLLAIPIALYWDAVRRPIRRERLDWDNWGYD
jgi:hypothetical protein